MTITYRKIRYIILDYATAFLAWVLFFIVRKFLLHEGLDSLSDYPKLLAGAAAVSSFWILIYWFFGFYHDIFRKSRIKEILNVFHASVWGCLILFFFVLLDDSGITDYTLYYRTLSSYFALHCFLSATVKAFEINHLKNLIKSEKIVFNTIMVGSGSRAQDTLAEIQKSNHFLGFKWIGYVDIENSSENELAGKLRYWGSYTLLPKLLRRTLVHQIIIAVEPSEHERIKDILRYTQGLGAKVSIIPDLYQIIIGSVKVEHVLGVPLIDIDHDLMPYWQSTLKRALDVAVSVIVITAGLPFFIFLFILTKYSSPGPAFFVQERVGLHGKLFKMIKFRSMYVNAEQSGPALSSQNDPRITPWGLFMRKTRIDELPQFVNVLLGDMSLVGPRPERKYFIDQLVQIAPEYRYLQRIRPGLTSLGQVKYGYAENIEQMLERLKYDLLYIENMSIANDFRILYFTIRTVLRAEGK